MRGTKMWRWRVCRMERWCMVLLVAVAGVVGEGTWWQSGPGINWDVSGELQYRGIGADMA